MADLAECLVKMGAKISGIGSATMTVEGVESICTAPSTAQVPDRIEAGTFLCAVAMAGGKVVVAQRRAGKPWKLCSTSWPKPAR